jgi:hypothetical protein
MVAGMRKTALALALALVPGIAQARPPLVTVGVDLRGLGDATFRRLDGPALERRILARLVQEGFAAVASKARPDILVRVSESPGGLEIEAKGGEASAHRIVPVGSDPLPELHLELAQKAVELVRAVKARLSPPPPPPPPPPPSRPPPPRPPAALPIGVEGSAGALALVRGGGTDALARFALRFAPWPRVGLHFATALAPASAASVDVLEVQLQAGLGYRWPLASRLDLEIALHAGLLLHRYDLKDTQAVDPRGTRADFLASLSASLLVWPLSWLGIELRIAPGLADESREHLSGSAQLWRRSAVRFEAGLGMVARFR